MNTTTWYRVERYGAKIIPFEVIRESEKMLFVPGPRGEQREAKECSYYRNFPTWKDAHTYLLRRAERQAVIAAAHLESWNKTLDEIKAMKE